MRISLVCVGNNFRTAAHSKTRLSYRWKTLSDHDSERILRLRFNFKIISAWNQWQVSYSAPCECGTGVNSRMIWCLRLGPIRWRLLQFEGEIDAWLKQTIPSFLESWIRVPRFAWFDQTLPQFRNYEWCFLRSYTSYAYYTMDLLYILFKSYTQYYFLYASPILQPTQSLQSAALPGYHQPTNTKPILGSPKTASTNHPKWECL